MLLDHYNPTRLITGNSCLTRSAALLEPLGKRCLIVTGKHAAKQSGALDDVLSALSEAKISYDVYNKIEPNPSIASCAEAARLAKASGAQFVVGIGGGSALDAAKAAAALGANDIPPDELFTLKWPNNPLPIIAVGTTAGTGSEVTSVAVITNSRGLKTSVRDDRLYPRIAFGDPKYTYSAPYDITVSTALDTVAHAAESWFNTAGSHVSDMFAKSALELVFPALTELERLGPDNPPPPETREALYYASVLAGYAIARAGTSYPHRMGYFLTEKFAVPHGTACSAFIPAFLRRAAELEKDKTARLCSGAGFELADLAALTQRLCAYRPLEITQGDVEFLIKRGDGTPAFLGATPAFTAGEARELIERVFIVGR